VNPSASRILGRGLARHCPRCGAGHLFHHWFTMVETCPRCRLRFEREEGYWAGALAVNFAVTGFVFIVVFVTAIALTAPDIPVGPLLAILLPLATVLPIVGYPFSKTIWLAIDFAFLHRLDRH
jgi:uncharacterized protein (DUF983 family)